MPSFTGKTFSNFYKNILGINQTSNTGVDSTVRTVQDGVGNNTALSLSSRSVSVTNTTHNSDSAFSVTNKGASKILTVDTNNSKVLVGANQVAANTQYTHFGIHSADTGFAGASADTHYAVPFNTTSTTTTAVSMGSSTSSSFNDTVPASSLTISTTAHDVVICYWYVMDDITIDRVIWWQGADAATGDSTAAYLMGYTVDATTGSGGGDLSSGTKLASSSTVTNAGYEQAYYNQMTIHNADVDAGKVILFTFASDTVNSDYSINATIKFHIR
tara:strand:+ start:1028 stop:1846 length:819 start_codon:yes stop_codon:yes gene_type:complete